MDFLFMVGNLKIVDLARRVRDEGHSVRVCYWKEPTSDGFDGILEKVSDWRRFAEVPGTIIVFDDRRMGRVQDVLRAEGKLVIGGSELGERLEIERGYGQEIARGLGLPVVPFREFTDPDDAIGFVRDHPRRWVVKRSGNEDAHSIDYKGWDPTGADVVAWLELLRGRRGHGGLRFMLQEYIDGVEVGIGAWFNGDDWVMPFNVAFEHQPLMAGDVGPNTGEMYTTLWYLDDQSNAMFAATLALLTDYLRPLRHVGCVDLNAIVNETGIHPLEWTVRFGMPTTMLQYRLMDHGRPLADFFEQLASGTLQRFDYDASFCVGALVAAPPYPFPGYGDTYKGMPVSFPQDADFLEHLHLVDVSYEGGVYRTAGDEGYCFVVTETGDSPEQAGERALRRIQQIKGPQWLYRTDLGVGETEKLDRLAAYGWDVKPTPPTTAAKSAEDVYLEA